MTRKIGLLAFSLLFAVALWAQQTHTISGYITDQSTGERLLNASVYETKSLRGTTANNYGFYSLSLAAGSTVSISASFIGYEHQIVSFKLDRDTTINFTLNFVSDEMEEIKVVGQRNVVDDAQMSVVDVPAQKLQSLPVIMGESDVLKVMQLLPGVKSGTEGTSGIYVRGGSPDQNLFLLDGVPVYNAGHLLGFFSVFNPDAIKTAKIYKGGFPARYGGRLSSVVDISMKDGNMKKFGGDFSIGLISSKLSIEGPIIKDKTSFIISARRTYLDLLSKPFLMIYNNNSEEKAKGGAYFHDYNIKVNHIFSDRSRLYLSAYNGKDKGFIGIEDYYDWYEDGTLQEARDNMDLDLSWGNTIASARWNYLISPKLFSNTTFTYSKYVFDVRVDNEEANLTNNTNIRNMVKYYSGIQDLAVKVDFDYFPISGHEIKFGAQYTNHKFTPGVTKLSFQDFDDSVNSLLDSLMGNREIYANEITSYIEDDIALAYNLRMNVGVNLMMFAVEGKTFLKPQPRLSLRYKFSDFWSAKGSYSRMAQQVHLLTTAGISLPTDLWVPVTKELAPPVSDQYALGLAFDLPKNLNLTVEGYYKNMQNLIEYKEGAAFMGTATNWEDKVAQGRGWAYGVELMLEKNVGKTTGWIGYTLAWANRKFDDLNGGKVFPSKYDSRHDINVAITHKFSDRFDIGFTWVYNTGNAVTLGFMEYRQAQVPGYYSYGYESIPAYTGEHEGRNNYRMPNYHRMDIGFNFHKEKKHGIRTWSISAYNVYSRQNPFYVSWSTTDGVWENGDYVVPPKVVLKQYSLFPIIPSVSYSFKF